MPSGKINLPQLNSGETGLAYPHTQLLDSVGSNSINKPYVFAIMPYLDEIEDVFFYGIQRPINAAGYLCERSDPIPETSRALHRVLSRIETASYVVAELSTSSPDVYMELGYALGKQRPTFVLVQEGIKLPFIAQAYKCITYQRIRDLEQSLAKEIQGVDGILR